MQSKTNNSLPLLLGAVLLSGSAQAACPDAAIALGKVEGLVMDASFDQVKPAIQEVEAAWSCGDPVQSAQLARLLLLQAGWLSMSGAKEEANLSWQAAHRLSPETWVENLGPQLKQEYLAAQAAPPAAPGQVILDPVPDPTLKPHIDGTPVTLPAPTLSGFHLVQVTTKKDDALFARLILVQPGETVTVGTGSLQDVMAARDAEKKPFPTLVVTGVGTGLLAGGAAWLAMSQDENMQDANSVGALKTAYTRQRILAVSSYTLSAAAVAQVSLHFAL